MQLSHKGAIFIGRFEGWVDHLYNDVGNDAHIGYGHRLHDGPYTDADIAHWEGWCWTPQGKGNLMPGRISKEHGLELLQHDAQQAAAAVEREIDVTLRQGQIDALISFTFNLGAGAFHESPIPWLINAGNPQAARKELLKYDHVGTERFAGLTKRRRAEARLFRTGNYFLAKL